VACEVSLKAAHRLDAGHAFGFLAAERLTMATLGRVAHREDWPQRDEIPRRFFNPKQMRFNSSRPPYSIDPNASESVLQSQIPKLGSPPAPP
jgi:hypothetical protein